jgi:hypothetical protein
MSSHTDSSAEFCSPSFDRALAELALPELGEPPPPLPDHPASSVRFLANAQATPSPEWPNEDEMAAFDEFEAEQSRKRKREEVAPEDVKVLQGTEASSSTKDVGQVDSKYEDHPAYVASKFGGIGAYMRHKREKL